MGAMLKNRFEQGFSIFELLIVMFIIAIIAGMGIPRFQGSLEKAEIRSAAGRIAAAIRASRYKAVSEKIPLTVVIDAENRKLFAVREIDRESSETGESVTPVELIPESVEIWRWREQVTKAYVDFHPSGTSSGGTFLVVPSAEGKIGDEDGQIITIDPMSGRVKVTSVKSFKGEAR